MDTYGDMVTLLLCFFVLLYSISSVDQNKWRLIVESFNPEAIQDVEQIVVDGQVVDSVNNEVEGAPPPELDAGEDETFEELYVMLKKAIEERNLQDSVELTQGDGFTFISFRDQVFFDGNSSILRKEGEEILDDFSEALGAANKVIKEIEVMGHTAQADPRRPSNIRNDRMLSAQRSAEVIIYIQSKGVVEPEKLVGMSYGQYRPIDTFETSEGRARNRRVEILIMKTDAKEQSLEDYYKQVYNRSFTEDGEPEIPETGGNPDAQETGGTPAIPETGGTPAVQETAVEPAEPETGVQPPEAEPSAEQPQE